MDFCNDLDLVLTLTLNAHISFNVCTHYIVNVMYPLTMVVVSCYFMLFYCKSVIVSTFVDSE